MSWGKLAGNVLGTAIVLGITQKAVLDPLYKRKKKKSKTSFEEMFELK